MKIKLIYGSWGGFLVDGNMKWCYVKYRNKGFKNNKFKDRKEWINGLNLFISSWLIGKYSEIGKNKQEEP